MFYTVLLCVKLGDGEENVLFFCCAIKPNQCRIGSPGKTEHGTGKKVAKLAAVDRAPIYWRQCGPLRVNMNHRVVHHGPAVSANAPVGKARMLMGR